MTNRPAFFPRYGQDESYPLVEVVIVDFPWVPGIVKSQRQKCIESFHDSIRKLRPASVLEISSNSRDELGINLSAFNLGFVHPETDSFICVESAYQGSKVFETSGPFPELYCMNAWEAKKYFKGKTLGSLVQFNLFGQSWPLKPRTLFYDWLYLNSLHRNPLLATQALKYDCFTDIEFNPKKSINCQAYSAALFVALFKRGKLKGILENQESFLNFMESQLDWIDFTEYGKHHFKTDKKKTQIKQTQLEL